LHNIIGYGKNNHYCDSNGIFGGLVGGPILSLADYYGTPERRFWTFIIPEFMGFGCLILMVIRGKSKEKKK